MAEPPTKGEQFWTLAFALLSMACAWPIFYARYVPIQDLPQHLAAVRVLHDFGDPELAFSRFFELDLWRTQYLAYYLAADLLSYVVDVELANRLLLAASLVATPYALRSLLQALGKDPQQALLAFPLAYSAHLILGFLNFLAAIPLCFYGIALAVRQRRSPSRVRAIFLALVALATFYMHVVPFALMALGVVSVSLSLDLRASARRLLPLLPAGMAALLWLRMSPAGQATLQATSGADRGPQPIFLPAEVALKQTPAWLTDVFAGDSDVRLLAAWAGLVVFWIVVGFVGSWRRAELAAPDALGGELALRLSALWPLCAALYLVAPSSYDWIWPIAQRFPLLCALCLLLALPTLRIGRELVLVLAFLLACANFHVAGSAFAAFSRDEVGDFDAALAALPKRKRVVGLIFDRSSTHVAFSPFIHFVAYYQTRKGGAVMFSFADFPQSPFRFKKRDRPPRVPPRWEWLPARVSPRDDLAWYDYALVRGGPGAIARPNSGFTPAYRGARWSVWRRLP